MIEYALSFAIGFLAASLAAVFAVPRVLRRALRLAGRHARIQTSQTKEGAAADRDFLKAGHAVELVRLERRLINAEHNAAELRTINGRQSVLIIKLEADAAERKSVIFDVRSELDKQAAQRSSLVTALTADQIALHDAFSRLDRTRAIHASNMARVGELMAEASRNRARIAISVARAEHLEALLSSAEARLEEDRSNIEPIRSLAARDHRIAKLKDQLRSATGDRQALKKRLDRAEFGRDEFARQRVELDVRPHRVEQSRGEILFDKARETATPENQKALGLAKAEIVDHEARLAAVPAKAGVNQDAPTFPTVQGAVATDGGAADLIRMTPADLEALRRENDGLRVRLSTPATAQYAAENAALRTSIKCFGWEARRLFVGRTQADPDGEFREEAQARTPPEWAGEGGTVGH